jgi:hypothetical protein
MCARARIRNVVNDRRIHVALEIGQFLQWVDGPVTLRRFGDAGGQGLVARIVHLNTSSVTLEVLDLIDRIRSPEDTIPMSDP